MSLNAGYAMNQEKVDRFGKVFSSIDFTRNQKLSNEYFQQNGKSAVVGEFHINGMAVPITLHELQRIQETVGNAQDIIYKSYRLGLNR